MIFDRLLHLICMIPATEIIADTARLLVRKPVLDDAAFILRLLNEPSWLLYIGDRNVRTLREAQLYLQNGSIRSFERLGFGFGTVILKSSDEPIGICGLVKRDFLDHPDLGFAFLPEFTGKGYAFEAATGVIQFAVEKLKLPQLLAFTIRENTASIKLLHKLGFAFQREILHDQEELLLYGLDLS